MNSPAEIRAHLSGTLQSTSFQHFFSTMKSQEPLLASFSTPEHLLAWLHEPQADTAPDKDKVLLFLMTHQQEKPHPSAQTLLVLALWPGLDHLYKRFRFFTKEQDERWAEIQWAFFQVVAGYPTQRRMRNVAGQVLLDVRKVLTTKRELAKREKTAIERMREIYLAAERDIEDGSVAFQDLLERSPEPAWTPLDDEEISLGESLFQQLVDQGFLSESDSDLLSLTILQEIPLTQAAPRIHLSYETAKKRKQRALRVVQKILTQTPDVLLQASEAEGENIFSLLIALKDGRYDE